MEFTCIEVDDRVDCKYWKIFKQFRTLIYRPKYYNKHIKKCHNQRDLITNKEDCIICSIILEAINRNYLEDASRIDVLPCEKLKVEDPNNCFLLLKTPCLKERKAEVSISKEFEVVNAGSSNDNKMFSSEKLKVDDCKIHAQEEINSDKIINQEKNTICDEVENHNGDKITNMEEVRGPAEEDNLDDSLNDKTSGQLKCLKAPCLNSVENNDLFRKTLIKMLLPWFRNVDGQRVKSNFRKVNTKVGKQFSTVYEWVLYKNDINEQLVVVIPLCILGDSQLLLNQSYALCINEKKVLSAYIHNDFDMNITHLLSIPSKEWIIDVFSKMKYKQADNSTSSHEV